MKSERTKWLESICWFALAGAVIPNGVESFGDVDGDWWTALRWTLSSLFVVSLIAVVVSRVVDNRAQRPEQRQPG